MPRRQTISQSDNEEGQDVTCSYSTFQTAIARWLPGSLLVAASVATFPAVAQEPEIAKDRLAAMSVDPTPERLIQFAAQGDIAVVELMLKAGVSVNRADPIRGATALHNAAAQGHLKLLNMLLEWGARPNTVDWHGNTPLISAAYFGRLEIVRTLLEKGANINAVSQHGITALSAAIYSGKEPVVSLLLARGANPALPESGSASPLAVAERAKRDAIAASIVQRSDKNK